MRVKPDKEVREIFDKMPSNKNPHTARLLALTRQLADNMIASGQRNPEYEILSEMMLARRAELYWRRKP